MKKAENESPLKWHLLHVNLFPSTGDWTIAWVCSSGPACSCPQPLACATQILKLLYSQVVVSFPSSSSLPNFSSSWIQYRLVAPSLLQSLICMNSLCYAAWKKLNHLILFQIVRSYTEKAGSFVELAFLFLFYFYSFFLETRKEATILKKAVIHNKRNELETAW